MIAALLSISLHASAGIPDSLPAEAFPNYLKVDETLAVGGQPAPETLARLKELGFRTVITLRPEAEGPAEEQAVVEKQGLRFLRVPVTPATFSEEDVDAVVAILDDPKNAPVLLHCSSSNRVGGLLAVREARGGKPADEALAAGKKLGLSRPEMVEAVRKVMAAGKQDRK